jgi:membrane fusion protein (multidrug efflux system)
VILQGMLSHRNSRSFAPLFLLLIPFISSCDSSEQQAGPQAAQVTVVEVEPKDTPIVTEFVGKTASSRRVEIRSRVEGFLEKRFYTEGTIVEAGDILFEIDKKPFQAQLDAARAELSQQQARMTTAKANLDRVKPLAKQNAVAKKELDDALGNYNTAAAAVEAAQAKVVQAELNLGYCTIFSPVTGVSSYATQREGAYIGMGSQALTYVAQLDPIWVEFSVSENQLLRARQEINEGRIADPKSGEYDVEIVLGDGSVFPKTGRIAFADASLSEETGTFLIRAEIENPSAGPIERTSYATRSADRLNEQLRPGQFVRVRLRGASRPNAILVPQAAVQQGAKGSFVWVVKDGEAEFRPIVVGPWHEDEWFIDSGLAAGDKVVVGGALKLRAGAPVEIVQPEEKTPEADQTQPDKAAGKG